MHVDQLPVKDCQKLLDLSIEWLNAPDPNVQAMNVENTEILKNLDQSLPKDPTFPAAEVRALVSRRLPSIIENLKHPRYERALLPPIQGSPLAVQFVEELGIEKNLDQIESSYARDQAKMQLLGVHAAIRLYRWNHDRS